MWNMVYMTIKQGKDSCDLLAIFIARRNMRVKFHPETFST